MEKKENKYIFLNVYKKEDICKVFSDKENCKFCPFKMTYKGKIEFAQGDYHRFYCLFGYVFQEGLGLIMNTSPSETQKQLKRILEADKIIKTGKSPDFIYPDIVRVHPKARPDKLLLTINVIRIKELGMCYIDRWKKGEMSLSKELIEEYNKYMRKYGRPEYTFIEQKKLRTN